MRSLKMVCLLTLVLNSWAVALIAQNKSNIFESDRIIIEKCSEIEKGSFGASFVDNELWYSAFTQKTEKIRSKLKRKAKIYKVFGFPLDREGNIDGEKEMKLTELGGLYHAGPVSWCESTQEMFVTLSNSASQEEKNNIFQKANINLKIVVVKRIDGKWKQVEKLPFNSSLYSVGHPAISVTGDTLFFASDMPGEGYGKSDIYMSIRENGRWGNPINLGGNINTEGNDLFPYVFRNNLIFASNGRSDRKGGLDLYCASWEGNEFGIPQNIEALNSTADDFGFAIHPDEKVGYYSSGKEMKKGYDHLYKIEITDAGKRSHEPIFTDLDKGSQEPLQNENKSDSQSLSSTGKTKDIEKEKQNYPQKKKPLQNEVIYFDFDKWDITPESRGALKSLIRLLKDNPDLILELASHTDSRGSKSYNLKLSQNRAESVVAYLVTEGINKQRIKIQFWGDTKPVHDCPDDASCPEWMHRKNRRVELIVFE